MVQALGPAEDVPPSLWVCRQDFQCVDEFTYLGVLIHSSCSSEPEIRQRCAMTRTAMQKLDHRLWCSHIATSTKLHLYNTYILPIMLYASECWTVNKADVLRWTSGACEESLASNGRISWGMKMSVMPLSNLHFPLLSRPVASLCLAILPKWMSRRMLAVSSSNHRQRSGRNLADGHAIHGSGLLLTTWQTPTVGFRKQERMLRTGSAGGCLRSIAQRTRSSACSYWIGCFWPLFISYQCNKYVTTTDQDLAYAAA